MKILISVLIICFSIFLSGCFTTPKSDVAIWKIPQQPSVDKVELVHIYPNTVVKEDGYYINIDNARNLANNVDEMKTYIAKMELLLKEIIKQYNIKTEEYKKTNE